MDASIDPLNVTSQHITDPVDAVDGLVDENTAALLVPGSLPVTAVIIIQRTVPGQIRTGRKDLSEISAGDHFLQLFHTLGITGLENTAQLYTGLLLNSQHPVGILKRNSDRLLRQYIDACFHSLDSHDRMKKMRKTKMYHIDLLIQDLIKICGPGTAELIGKLLCLLRNLVYGIDKLDLICQSAERICIGNGNPSAAYDGNL